MIGAPEHESEKGNRFPDKIMLKQNDTGWIGISLRRKPKLAPEVATAGVASVHKSSNVVKEGDKVRLLGPAIAAVDDGDRSAEPAPTLGSSPRACFA